MRVIYKRLILVFILLCILKIALSFLIPSPTMFADEYYYSSMARSFYKDGNFVIFGYPSTTHPPLYSIIVSVAYIFKDMRVVYSVFKIINALLSSLIIFPAWLLAKEFFNKRKSFWIACLCGIWPVGFIFSFFVMSENLFYFLFLFTVYFVYKSFADESIKWDFFAGLLLGLTYLTKMSTISLIIAIFIFSLFYIIKERDVSQIKRKILLYFISLLIVLPWLIRNGSVLEWTLSGIMGMAGVMEVSTLGQMANNIQKDIILFFAFVFYWILIYLSYLILATGGILFLFNLLSFRTKDKKFRIFSYITWISIICFVVFSSMISAHYDPGGSWLVGRPLGRYVASCIPLIIILGFANLKFKENFYKNKLKYILILSTLIIASFMLFSFKLFPVNSISLSYIGFIGLGIKYLITNNNIRILTMTIIFGLLPFGLLLIKYINFKKLLYFASLFFILINIIAFSMIYYNSNYRWHNLDQMQLGLWFNDNVDLTNVKILFDERDDKPENFLVGESADSLKKIPRLMRRAAFWMNAYIEVDSIDGLYEYDYVISKHDLDHNLVKEIGDFRLYKIRD